MIGVIALCIAIVTLVWTAFAWFILGKLIAAFKEMADDLLEWAESLERETTSAIADTHAGIRRGARRTDHRFKLDA